MSAAKPSPAMYKALTAIHEAGSAVIQAHGILAAGEWLPHDGKTFLRLAGLGLVTIKGNRIELTDEGAALDRTRGETP